jgi:HK97 family phage portal protein
MPVVLSGGSFVQVRDPAPPRSFDAAAVSRPAYSSSWYSTGDPALYASMWRAQPEVRTVIDFLARNIAQLGLHAYRRISDNDRERLSKHEILGWIAHPNPATSQYRLIETLMIDLGIYFSAYWLKVRLRDPDRIGLLRLPPEQMQVEGWLIPSGFVWTSIDGTQVTLAPKDVVFFTGYDACNPLMGLSPLETLRRLLQQEAAATDYRSSFWQNSARLEGVIQRPREAPKWTPEQKQSWREQWQARYAGQPGQVAVLEDGMTYNDISSTADEAQYVEARKLTREECAAAYHVPLPMVGILDHATFSNVKEQHKQLYQDTLGPWLIFLQDELERQLLIDCDDTADVYLEFNIAEKLKGSFEEQANSLQALVGRPIMTANEGRARLNLPAITNDPTADQLAQQLNQASAGVPVGTPSTNRPTGDAAAVAIRRVWARQRGRVGKLDPEARPAAFDMARWDRELAADLEHVFRDFGYSPLAAAQRGAALASTVNAETLQLLVTQQDAFGAAREAGLYV